MAIAADTGTSAGVPVAKFARLGDKLIGAYGGAKPRQQTEFGSQALKTKPDGKPMMEEVNWFVAMPGTTAGIGKLEDGLSVIMAGDIVRFMVSGFRWKQFIDGRKALPPYAGLKAGQIGSGDVYELTLTGWSVATENAEAARRNGFTVLDGRIVMTTEADHDAYVLAQSKRGGNANTAKDVSVSVRRPTPAESAWEAKADELFLSKPWMQKEPAMAGGGGAAHDEDLDPF